MKVEVSNGELLDKLSILSIKSDRMENEKKRKEASKEHDHLLEMASQLDLSLDHDEDYDRLKEINGELWWIEDRIREKEEEQAFDEEFIKLSRDIYFLNDERFIMKNRINIKTNSEFKEQKSHNTCDE